MPRSLKNIHPVLSNRDLNRATLARQSLIEKSHVSPDVMIEHLVGMQAQAPMPPYFGLWSRLKAFQPDDLSRLILDRSVVRIVLMRGTVHLVTANDALLLRPLIQPMLNRASAANTTYRAKIEGIDLQALAAYAREVIEERPQTLVELRPILAERWPSQDPEAMAFAVRNLLPLVQIPPRGIWGSAGQPACTTLESWTGRPVVAEPSIDDVVRRYIAAFGPVSVRDAQSWSGLTRLGEVFTRLRPELVTFQSEDGRELFDLPDAPRPAANTLVPVRILAAFDNILLSHADRKRILRDEHSKHLFTKNGLIRSTVLVDGFVAGVVTTDRKKETATLTVHLWHEISSADREAVAAEGARLLAFAEPTAATHTIDIINP